MHCYSLKLSSSKSTATQANRLGTLLNLQKRSRRLSFNLIKDITKGSFAMTYFRFVPACGGLFLPSCAKAVLNLKDLRASFTALV